MGKFKYSGVALFIIAIVMIGCIVGGIYLTKAVMESELPEWFKFWWLFHG